MNDTQRLLSIALAVIALEGCRGASTNARAPETSPTPASHGSGYHGGHGLGGAAAGVLIGGAMRRNGGNNRPQPYGPSKGANGGGAGARGGFFSHFGFSGFHGGG